VNNNNPYVQEEADGKFKKSFIFIHLKDGVNIKTAVDAFNKCGSLSLFSGEDNLRLVSDQHLSPFYNVILLADENTPGAESFQSMSTNQSTQSNASMINIILIAILFVVVFVSMNIVAGSSIRELGLLSVIGLEPLHIKRIVILQALFTALLSFPLGVALGIGIVWMLIENSIMVISGNIVLPIGEISIDLLFFFLAIFAASIYPAWKAGHGGSPLEALNARPGAGIPTNFTGDWPRLERSSGKIQFSILLGLKNAYKNFMRSFLLIASVALLMAFFISFTKEIEIQWKMGTGRSPYLSDYTIEVNMIQYPKFTYGQSSSPIYNNSFLPADTSFLNQLKKIAGVQSVYAQSSVVDGNRRLNASNSSKGIMYNYYFKLNNSQITSQGKIVFETDDIIKRDGYPNNSFVSAGIGGYGDDELTFAKKYLVEGSIDISEMKIKPIILLPKYIQAIGNLNIPYTNLRVGDKITIVEDKGNDHSKISPVKEYTFTIGGFVNSLPFEQINGASHGFTAIMSENQLNKLDTEYKGIRELYLDAGKGMNPLPQITKLANSRGYKVTDNKDTFENKEAVMAQNQNQISLYILFAVLALVIFIVIFNLFLSDTLARKSEFALLTAVGMTKGQIYVSAVSEALFAGLLGLYCGHCFWVLAGV
jgi:putative ABC transport system permease protein